MLDNFPLISYYRVNTFLSTKKITQLSKTLRIITKVTEILLGQRSIGKEKDGFQESIAEQKKKLYGQRKESRKTMFKLETKFEKMREHSSQRMYSQHRIRNDKLGYYYTHGEDSTHDNCYRCKQVFGDGEKVYLTNYFHEYDVITPFPYCSNCIESLLVSTKL